MPDNDIAMSDELSDDDFEDYRKQVEQLAGRKGHKIAPSAKNPRRFACYGAEFLGDVEVSGGQTLEHIEAALVRYPDR